MIYIISGKEPYLIDNKINLLIKENGGDVVKIDGNAPNFSYDDIIESCTSIGLFSNKSIVLVRDPIFFKKKIEDKKLDQLIDYCKNPVYENDLVFYTLNDDFKKILKAYKDISKNAQKIECNIDPKNFYTECVSLANKEQFSLRKDLFNYLVTLCNNNLTLFKQNIDVLKLYPDQIDKDCLDRLCSSSDEENIFELINAIKNKEVSRSISLLRKIMKNEDSILGLIALIASQLRYTYEVDYYYSLGESIDSIAYKTNSKSFRVSKTINTLNKNECLNLLNKLADLDLKCKTSSDIDEKNLIELFIVSML